MLAAIPIHAERAGDMHVQAANGAKLGYYHGVIQDLRLGLVSATAYLEYSGFASA